MTSSTGKIILGILILLAAVVWFSRVHSVFAMSSGPNGSAPLSIGLDQFTAGAIAARTAVLPGFDETGIVFMDTTKTPAAPYIAYENSKYQLLTKALIFNQSRGCDVSAGEFPCARNIDESDDSDSDASPIPAGTIVHMTGGISDQAVIVDSYDTVASLPINMTSFQATIAQQVQLSNGVTVQPQQILTGASCTLGVGCFGDGVDRVETVVGKGTSTTTTDFVPGTLFVFGKSTILLLSIAGAAGHEVATFLVDSAS